MATCDVPVTQVVGIVVLSAVFLGERDIFTVRMVIGCASAGLAWGLHV